MNSSNKIYLWLAVIVIILLFGYLFFMLPNNSASEDTEMNTGDNTANHIGCQEGEIELDGTCVPADENNSGLFDDDLSAFVQTMDISSPTLGFIAKPRAEGTYPGVVMIHEWWGLNDNIKQMAQVLANEGYVVYAVDLYDGEVATDSGRAGELATEVRNNPDEALQKMESVVSYLQNDEQVSGVASLGWCFGGGESLHLALYNNLDATVIYYGQLTDDTSELQNISWPVLGIFGEEDTSIPVADVNNFQEALDDLNITNTIYIYPGVGHAFANPSGANFAPEETRDAWQKTLDFLSQNLKSPNTLMMDDEGEIKTFELTGEDFSFRMNGEVAPDIRVNEGDMVRIELTSIDGMHDWVIDEFDAATNQITTGQTTSIEFIADQKGTFEYYCSVGQHRANGMFGTFIVE